MSQKVEELVKLGQSQNLMDTNLRAWESTTTAGTQTQALVESGATLWTQTNDLSTALSLYARPQN